MFALVGEQGVGVDVVAEIDGRLEFGAGQAYAFDQAAHGVTEITAQGAVRGTCCTQGRARDEIGHGFGLGEIEAVGESGAGMVKVTLTGKKEARAVSIAPSLVDPEDIEVLEDLLVAAFNDAAGRVDQTVQEETQKLMGDIKLPPGMKLPF